MARLEFREAVERRACWPHFSCESSGPTGGCSLDGTAQQSQRPVAGGAEAAEWARAH